MKINIFNILKVLFYFRWVGFSLGENTAFEIYYFHKIRDYVDGVTFFNFDCSLDFRGNHKPRFHIFLMVMNYVIIELNIFNTNHIEDYE